MYTSIFLARQSSLIMIRHAKQLFGNCLGLITVEGRLVQRLVQHLPSCYVPYAMN